MARKREEPVVRKVMFTYTGTNHEFNAFLRAIIYDYLVMEYGIENIIPSSIAL